MRLVKIRLGDIPFWFLENIIKLNNKSPVSEFINVDSLSYDQRDIIDRSISRMDIKLFDVNGNRIQSLEDTEYISGEMAVDTEDVGEDESYAIPEVVSVTISEDEEEEESIEPTDVDIENAKILLGKNGNTVKKAIKEIANTNEGLMLLHACLNIEKVNRNRAKVIQVIGEAIARF